MFVAVRNVAVKTVSKKKSLQRNPARTVKSSPMKRAPVTSVNRKRIPTIGMSWAMNRMISLRVIFINLYKGNILLSIYS